MFVWSLETILPLNLARSVMKKMAFQFGLLLLTESGFLFH